MSGFPFPTSQHKWMGIAEAKHPLVQDLIKLWEESPGYILPQGSFIQDKAKLEALIDSVIEMQKQKVQMANAPKPAAKPVQKNEAASAEDPNWEKNLMKALSTAKMQPAAAPKPAAPNVPKLSPELAKIPGAEEKLAQLKLVSSEVSVKASAVPTEKRSMHILILYVLSGTAFALACLALAQLTFMKS